MVGTREQKELRAAYAGLNPFEIRAWLAPQLLQEQRHTLRLNPFEIRAWLAPANMAAYAEHAAS